MLPIECIHCRSIEESVQRTQVVIVNVGWPAAVGELISITGRRNGVRAEHILHALSERLIVGVELRQIFNHMRKVLDRSTGEVIAGTGVGENGRTIALERAD